MISVSIAEKLHARSIEEFGGASGLRDVGALEAALARAYQTFDGVDLYPTIAGKAAALMEAIIIRHPWVDGNKRTGLGLALFLLMKEGCFVNANQQELYDITIKVAEGRSNAEEIQKWFEKRLKSI